jgi:hypothetical protein
MEFFELKRPIRQIGFNEYIIGENVLDPQLKLQQNNLEIKSISVDNVTSTDISVNRDLFISGIHFIDYITGHDTYNLSVQNNISQARHGLKEAFEKDENGDLTPTDADNISDTMWILREDDNLELRSNHWRYNTGPNAFTEDISF